jgi:hypothetical protein
VSHVDQHRVEAERPRTRRGHHLGVQTVQVVKALHREPRSEENIGELGQPRVRGHHGLEASVGWAMSRLSISFEPLRIPRRT